MTDVSLTWRSDLSADRWDAQLADLQGHPLQSALWGDARRNVDGIIDHRWVACDENGPVLMARFEERPVGPIGRAAWMPRGPVCVNRASVHVATADLLNRLRLAGYLLSIDDPYQGDIASGGVALLPKPRTAWIDLTTGRHIVWKAIDPQWRYGVRTAARQGVVIEQTRDADDVQTFFALCDQISARKGFELPGSAALLNALLAAGVREGAEARLFVARYNGALAGGAAVIRCGRRLHYFWGAVDRAFSKQRPGEAVHGTIIDWAIEQGIERYDLEGIDPIENPGTYRFKMKMGAIEVELPGRSAYPLGTVGKLALAVGRRLGRV